MIEKPKPPLKKKADEDGAYPSLNHPWTVLLLSFKLVQWMRVAGHHISHYIYSCSCLKLLRDNSADATLSMEWFAVCRWSGQTFILIATRVQLLTFKSLHVNDSFLCSLHTYQIHIEKVSFCTMKISVLLGSWSCKTAIVFLRWIKQNSAQIVLTT